MAVDPKPAEAQAESLAPLPEAPTNAPSPASVPDVAVTAEPPHAEAAAGADAHDDPMAEGTPADAAASAPAGPYSPYTSGPLPTVQWDPTYGSRTYPYPIVRTDGPGEGDAPDAGLSNAAPPTTATTALPGYPSGPVPAEMPAPPDAYPAVDYGAYTDMPFAPPLYDGMAGPPGMMAPQEYAAAPMPVMRDEVLEGRITALEWQAYELASRTRDAEIDLLMHKVGSLEEMIMRFLTEVPIRLGGEIGVLDRRLAYLSEELPARLQADSSTATEQVERLGQRVAAIERYMQTMPSTRWRTEQEARYETLERRIVELEQFCAALARKGTAPREVAASTTENVQAMHGMHGPGRPAPTSAPNRNGGPGRGIPAREADRRHPR